MDQPDRTSYDDHHRMMGSIRSLIGEYLEGGEYMDDCIDSLIQNAFGYSAYDKPFYNGKYLNWDEGPRRLLPQAHASGGRVNGTDSSRTGHLLGHGH